MSKLGTKQETLWMIDPACEPGGHSTITDWFRHGQHTQLSHRNGLEGFSLLHFTLFRDDAYNFDQILSYETLNYVMFEKEKFILDWF